MVTLARHRDLAPGMAPRSFWRPRPRPEARLRIFCFHHAGGSSRSFATWPRLLSERFELLALELPGRGDRSDEPGPGSASSVLQELLRDVPPLLDRPYVLFGHSMGAQLAFHLAKGLLQRGLPPPLRLFASASLPPSVFATQDHERMAGVPDAHLMIRLQELGGTPGAVLASAKLRARLLSAFRQDLRICASLPAVQGQSPLAITILGALDDLYAPPRQLGGWRSYTCERFRFYTFKGGHFYLVRQLAVVLDTVCRDLAESEGGVALPAHVKGEEVL